MSRLLFAAARGARIEYKGGYPTWRDAEGAYMTMRGMPEIYRIRPDDEHLQYGPISTALRELEGKKLLSFYDFGNSAVQYYAHQWLGNGDHFFRGDELHRSLFLLILSEALADEGL